jgi:16S rRNA G1207 methylase RsmC
MGKNSDLFQYLCTNHKDMVARLVWQLIKDDALQKQISIVAEQHRFKPSIRTFANRITQLREVGVAWVMGALVMMRVL